MAQLGRVVAFATRLKLHRKPPFRQRRGMSRWQKVKPHIIADADLCSAFVNDVAEAMQSGVEATTTTLQRIAKELKLRGDTAAAYAVEDLLDDGTPVEVGVVRLRLVKANGKVEADVVFEHNTVGWARRVARTYFHKHYGHWCKAFLHEEADRDVVWYTVYEAPPPNRPCVPVASSKLVLAETY